MILVIDNYDSFTYNIVQSLGVLGCDVKVVRNDKISISEVYRLNPTHIIVSPGPCTPNEAGVSISVVKAFHNVTPILGICLGHQCIAQAFGGKIVRAPRPVHGKTSQIYHDGRTIFRGLKNPFTATRYHSLIVDWGALPDCLIVSATNEEGLPMAIRHKLSLVEGVQFHPESFLTTEGIKIFRNFLKLELPGSRGSDQRAISKLAKF